MTEENPRSRPNPNPQPLLSEELNPEHVQWQKDYLDGLKVGAFWLSPRFATVVRKVSADTVTLSGLFPDAVAIMRRYIEAAGYKVLQDPIADKNAKEVRKNIYEAGEWPAHLPYPLPEDADDQGAPGGT